MKTEKSKKLTALLLTVTMLLCFAACGESDPETEEKKDSAGASASDSADVGSNGHDGVDIKDERVGTYITFGTYEQDGDTSNGAEPIEWLVLDVKGGKALVISKYGLAHKRFNEEYNDVTWETCTIRNWLNNDFYSTAFSSDEKNSILTTNVAAEDNAEYSVDAGNDTQDKVFLLSISEAKKYFGSDNERTCKPTQYMIDQGAYYFEDPDSSYEGNCWWWLRSPGRIQGDVSLINFDGVISSAFVYAIAKCVVRPAMWVKLG